MSVYPSACPVLKHKICLPEGSFVGSALPMESCEDGMFLGPTSLSSPLTTDKPLCPFHSQFNHQNIVKVLGVCIDNDPIYIIMELMPAGDLLKFLREARRDHVSLSYL